MSKYISHGHKHTAECGYAKTLPVIYLSYNATVLIKALYRDFIRKAFLSEHCWPNGHCHGSGFSHVCCRTFNHITLHSKHTVIKVCLKLMVLERLACWTWVFEKWNPGDTVLWTCFRSKFLFLVTFSQVEKVLSFASFFIWKPSTLKS